MESFLADFDDLEVRDADGRHELVGIAVPYDRVTDLTPGRRKEKFVNGAFASVVTAPAKIRLVDENHSIGRRPAGVAVSFEERAGAKPGLYGRWRFYDTPEGRAAFENAREGTYGGLSIGFAVPAGGDQVVAGIREIRQARLHHVSLVDVPAYEDAQILAVRTAPEPMDLSKYEQFAKAPTVEFLDDTPLTVRIGRLLH